MQKTDWTNYSSFLVWSVKGFHPWMWSLGGIQQPISCVFCHFRHGEKQTNNQQGDPRANLLFTSEKAICCQKRNNCHRPACNCVYHQCNGGVDKQKTKQRKMHTTPCEQKQTKQQPRIPPIELGTIITNFDQLWLYSSIMFIIPSP